MSEAASSNRPGSTLGALPEWNLADLYPGPESPELKADLEAVKAGAEDFKARFQGKLESGDASVIADAIARYEALGDKMGRIGAFAFLHYVGNQQDPARVKLFGDVQGKHRPHGAKADQADL